MRNINFSCIQNSFTDSTLEAIRDRKNLFYIVITGQACSGIIVGVGILTCIVGATTAATWPILGGAIVAVGGAISLIYRDIYVVMHNIENILSDDAKRVASVVNAKVFVDALFKNTYVAPIFRGICEYKLNEVSCDVNNARPYIDVAVRS